MGLLGRFRTLTAIRMPPSPYHPQRGSQDAIPPANPTSEAGPDTAPSARTSTTHDDCGPCASQHVRIASERPTHGDSPRLLATSEGDYARSSSSRVDEEMGQHRGVRDFPVRAGDRGSDGVGVRANEKHPTPNPRKSTFFGRILDKIFKFRDDDPFGPRPGLRTYLKMYWGDWLTLILLGALALGLLMWSPLPRNKYFALTVNTSTNEIANPEYAYPYQKQHLSILADAAIAVFTPILISFLINLLTVHSFWDLNNAVLGTVYAVMTACMVQIIIKLVCVGLRPYFLTVCNPQLPPQAQNNKSHSPEGVGFRNMYFTVDICTEQNSKRLAWAMQSFPSGHAATAWAGLFYLSLYLNGKLKPFANYHPSWWKLLAFLAPMVAATLIAGSLTLDNSHHWWDILVGSLIGVAMALCAYRMTFASIWDWRWNHVPLPRGNVMMYGEGCQWAYKKR